VHQEGLDMPRLAAIQAHRLRSAFATMAGVLGVQDRIVKAYLGQSSGDVLGGHYRRIGLDELRSVSGNMDGWRMIPVRKDSGNIATTHCANG
jgi:hypothetical protein